GQSRRNIFIEDKGRQTFLDLLADMARLWKVEIYAYCLMDNHYHLLLSATAQGYEKTVEELKRRKRGRENEARMVAIYLGRRSQARRDRQNGWTRENVVGELGLFADEGASG